MKTGSKMCGNVCMAVMIILMTINGNPCFADAAEAACLTPEAYGRGIIPLTPGSSTTIQNIPGQPITFVTVVALGQGTLKATLSKKDTSNDIISMLLIGYPADPAFVPNFGFTPADIAVSSAITDDQGGYGIFFFVITVISDETYTSSLALKLE